MQANFLKRDGLLDYYNAGAALACGDVVVVGTIVGFVNTLQGIASGEWGTLVIEDHASWAKATGAWVVGESIYWDVNGDPVGGTAGTGAATTTATGNTLIGPCEVAAASGDARGRAINTSAQRTATIAGSVTADDITGSDASLGIAGLSAAQGGAIAVAGGPSSTSGNAGGAVTVTGGAPGATGAGGAVTATGGAGGATSGTGGAVAIAGGAGTAGNANGGAVTILGGNAHGSGTDGVVSIGTSNTSAITIGAAGIVTTNTGHLQSIGNAAITATTGGGTTGLIPAGTRFCTVTSDSANKSISLPAADTPGHVIEILIGTTGCELISAVAADKVNEVVVGATNELALTAEALYTCKCTKSGFWIVTGETKLGARIAALVPDALA